MLGSFDDEIVLFEAVAYALSVSPSRPLWCGTNLHFHVVDLKYQLQLKEAYWFNARLTSLMANTFTVENSCADRFRISWGDYPDSSMEFVRYKSRMGISARYGLYVCDQARLAIGGQALSIPAVSKCDASVCAVAVECAITRIATVVVMLPGTAWCLGVLRFDERRMQL
ncbi:hypothetical protein CYMTET_15147 [Cymbomonas tetramitiformis]|uniref:Uncharacterized protein n=1 Tax=Cymbomonas tetramitiformis TaxID=36881 RepID=A0AAE0GEK6_9CHLO|nr:hypothetical protein CYMTET_15147 [Cymbomonas tetramitiformis]